MVRRGASRRMFEGAEVVCNNVSGLLVEQAPGHDEDSRVPVLISTTGPNAGHFFCQVSGTPLDCSAISLILAA
jgi:uncharacterized protein YsxB (DUF464 family)